MKPGVWSRLTNAKDVFVIAEVGVNHNGRLDLARKLVDAAVAGGADAVKFQTFDAKRLASVYAPKAKYQKQTTPGQESQLAMLSRLELNAHAHRELKQHCRRRKIIFCSSAFDDISADFLESLGVPFFKIPSGELTNLPYLKHLASFGKPMIVSTGMANMDEVAQAVGAIRKIGNQQIVLLHCVSNYPADVNHVNLKAMDSLARRFKLPVGYSDHTLGIDIALAACARGACVLEKHLTLDKNLNGPDHRMSLEPGEFKAMVDSIRRVSRSLGTGEKVPAPSERDVARVARKSLVAAQDIQPGEVLLTSMLCFKRPGSGLQFKDMAFILGKKARKMVVKDQLIKVGQFQ